MKLNRTLQVNCDMFFGKSTLSLRWPQCGVVRKIEKLILIVIFGIREFWKEGSGLSLFGESGTKPCLKCAVVFWDLADSMLRPIFHAGKKGRIAGLFNRVTTSVLPGLHNPGRITQL